MKKIYELNKLIKPFYEFTLSGKSYEAIFATGDFDGNGDYDRGFLLVTILFDYTYGDNEQVVGHITNIDDGVWQMFRDTTLSQDEALNLCKAIKKYFGTRLPNETILNGVLSEFGIYGIYTG